MAVFKTDGVPPLQLRRLKDLEPIFLGQAPQLKSFYYDEVKTSGKGFVGLAEKVYLQWNHYFASQKPEDCVKTEIREAEFLASRMADREFQTGETIYLNVDEVFTVAKTFVGGGAYISLLRNVNDQSKVKIVCRGTATRSTATEGLNSGLNDIQYEIGNGGIQAAWPSISAYLSKHRIAEVELYGKSLGGAHAQRLAILVMQHFEGLLKGLTTVCSVGVGPEAEQLFKGLVERDSSLGNLRLTVIRNGGDPADHGTDYIPCVGGEHLGSTVGDGHLDLNVYYIHHSSAQSLPNPAQNMVSLGYRFFSSFPRAHVCQHTITNNFLYQESPDPASKRKALELGTALERSRRWIAYRNKRAFTDFVRDPSARVDPSAAARTCMVASSIFFTLFTVGFMACWVLQPGAVMYQGSGIVLTLPTLLLAQGAGLSLLAIAIGSCMWSNHKKSLAIG